MHGLMEKWHSLSPRAKIIVVVAGGIGVLYLLTRAKSPTVPTVTPAASSPAPVDPSLASPTYPVGVGAGGGSFDSGPPPAQTPIPATGPTGGTVSLPPTSSGGTAQPVYAPTMPTPPAAPSAPPDYSFVPSPIAPVFAGPSSVPAPPPPPSYTPYSPPPPPAPLPTTGGGFSSPLFPSIGGQFGIAPLVNGGPTAAPSPAPSPTFASPVLAPIGGTFGIAPVVNGPAPVPSPTTSPIATTPPPASLGNQSPRRQVAN